MREWALHMMDLIENSLRAGASVITVAVAADGAGGTLEVMVEDNGPGLTIPLERAGDPFYTTKPGKTVGLGLSLFRAAVEETGGTFRAERPEGGGLRVAGRVPLAHVDRKPLGDVAETLWTLAATNPETEFRLRASANGSARAVSWHETRAAEGGAAGNTLRQARRFAEQARDALSEVAKIEQGFMRFERNGKE
jgi:anti-sigma regulatory factor (Ser/Thr protein kinase)